MGAVKQIDIKNRTDHFYNDNTDIKNFDSKLLKIDKKSYKDIDIGIYNISYDVNIDLPIYMIVIIVTV